MPKNNNGFMQFVHEWKQGKNMSIPEAVKKVSPIWNAMSKSEQARYKEKCSMQSAEASKPIKKLTCVGVPVSIFQREEEFNVHKEKLMKESIQNTVQNGIANGNIGAQKFYFIMTNYFLKSMRTKLYVPAEIAVCEYSLNDGVDKIYHTFFAPDEDETFGNLYDAMRHSQDTHRLPCPPNAMGNTSKSATFKDILDFITDSESGKIHPLYTANAYRPIVASVLEFFSNNSSYQEILSSINIYSIQHLFYTLKSASCAFAKKDETNITTHIIDSYFDKDSFEYESNISCAFHEENDRTKYCAQSYVTRWGYMISEYVCQDFGIPLLPGQHMPQSMKLDQISMDAAIDDNISIFSGATMNSNYTNPLGREGPFTDHDNEDDVSWTTVSKKKVLPTKPARLPRQPDRSFFEISQESFEDNDDMASLVSFGRARSPPNYIPMRSGRGRGRLFD